MTDDFYALLEVPPDATQDEIRDAFREKVRVYHPDHNDDPRANAQFTALKKAYDTLGDPVERNAYDRMGHLDYVGKRLDGLPDPEKWAPSEVDDGGAASARSSGSTGSTTSTGSSSRGRSTGASSSGSTGTSTGRSTDRSGTSGAGRTSSGSSNRTATGSRRSSTSGSSGASGGRRTASDGAGGTATGRSRQPHHSPIVSWIARHGLARRLVGWPLLGIALAVYAVGLVGVAVSVRGPLASLWGRVSAAGADLGALSTALERTAMPTAFEAAADPLRAGGTGDPVAAGGGALLLLGALLLPGVVALLVYLTRMSPGWRPTYLYVAAFLGPLAALAAGAVVTPPLAAELALVLLLPLGGLVVMLGSAFVRPRVKAALFG